MPKSPSEAKFDETLRKKNVLRLWLRLLSCERSIEQRMRSHLRENFDITLPQFEVLCELDHYGTPLVMSRLSELLKVTSSNITGVIDRLERDGIVKRFRSSEDRRVQYIDMTAKGRSAFVKIAADNALWVSRAFTQLSDKEVKQLQRLLLKARESAIESLG